VHYEFIDPSGEGMGAGKEDERRKKCWDEGLLFPKKLSRTTFQVMA
jgi:hypothetical protein